MAAVEQALREGTGRSTPIKIPAGEWFMMGDNRGESDDSRFWGPVPTSWITGVVRLSTPAG